MKGIGNLLKQAQKVQEEMTKIQEELAQKKVEATSGGGMVTVEVNGQQEILSIKIDPEVIKADDREMLEDLVLAAVNEGLRKAKDLAKEEMTKVAGGLNLPPGMGLG
jgi:DNA-binding YbaB/EbfC family protein